MQLINSQYKVKSHLNEDQLGNTLVTEDLYNGAAKILRIINDTEETRDFISYMKRNLPEYRNLVHPNLCRTYFFNKIISIDNKPVSSTKYYYAYQAVSGESISTFGESATVEEKIDIFYQLLSAIKYLHIRGFLLCNINSEDLFVESDNSNLESKNRLVISALPYLEHCARGERIDKENLRFIPPESFQFGNFTRISDIYLIGEICFYLFFGEYKSHSNFVEDFAAFENFLGSSEKAKIDEGEERILQVIRKCVAPKMMDRYHTVEDIFVELNQILDRNVPICGKNLVQRLPENITSQVGREPIITSIIKSAYERLLAGSPKVIALIKGGKGTGKSSLIKTLLYRFSQEGFNVSSEDASLNIDEEFYTIKSVIRNIRKYSSAKVLEKYNVAINEILSELTEKNQNGGGKNSGHNDNIHKAAQFIQEISEVVPLVICIDNIESMDEKSLAILYHLINLGSGKVFIVLSEGTHGAEKKKSVDDFLKSIKESGIIEEYGIGDLSVVEVGEYVRLLLGMDRIPQELAANIYKVTNGNPAAVFELVHKLVAEELLSVNEFCEWDIKKLEAKDLHFSKEGRDNLVEKLKFMTPKDRAVIEALSVFNIPITTKIVYQMYKEDRELIDACLRKLESNGFLVQKSDDRGNVFNFTSNAFKIRLYESLSGKRKKQLHRYASEALERLGAGEERDIEDEIIYHKINFGKNQEVIDYLVNIGTQAENNYDAAGAIKHYSRAIELLKPLKDKELYVKLLYRLGVIYEGISEFEMATEVFESAKKIAEEQQNIAAIIDINLSMIEIYINMGIKKEAMRHLVSAKKWIRKQPSKEKKLILLLHTADLCIAYKKIKVAEQVVDMVLRDEDINKYEELLAAAKIFKAKHLIDKGDLGKKVEQLLLEGLDTLEKHENWKMMVRALNVEGIYYDYCGMDQKAIKCYEQGLYIGDKTNNLEQHVRLYNNMAEIYRKEDRNKEAIALYTKAINLKGSEFYAIVRGVNYYNLAITYTDMEYLAESTQYKEVYESLLKAGQAMEYLEEFHYVHLSQFYYQLGDFEKSRHYGEIAETICKKLGIASDLEAKMYVVLGKAGREGKRDYSAEMEFLQNAVERKSYKLLRLVCVRLSIMSLNEGKREKAKEIYELGMKYRNEIETERLNFYYSLVESNFISNELKLDFLMKLTERVDRIDGFDLKIMLFQRIGEAYCEIGELKRGMYFYAIALNYLRKGIRHIPVHFQETYMACHYRYVVKESILKTAKQLYAEGMITKNILATIEKNGIFKKNQMEKYFDFNLLQKICISDEAGIGRTTKDGWINPFENLTLKIMEGLTSNPDKNLNWYVETVTKFCHGTNGFIIDYHGEENHELISCYGGYTKREYYVGVMEKVLQTQEPYFVRDVYELKEDENISELGEEVSTFVCIPIMDNSGATDWIFDKRKKSTGKNAILGFLFIESESIINNISIETVELCKKTIKICHLLMDNVFLHEMVSVDRLTQLYTRKHFEVALAIEIEKTIRSGGEFSLIMCDIDKFKSVNDSFGHQMGDEILRKVSAQIISSVRREDVCARYGGEEIVILLPGANIQIAMSIAEKIRMRIEGAKLMGTQRPLTISLGVANCPEHSTWANDLIEKADQALYFAKENGRNQTVLFSQTLTTEPKRIDKLAGIVSGELIRDQRSVETLLEIVRLSKNAELGKKEKYFQFLGRVIEAAEADFGIIIAMNESGQVEETTFRKKLVNQQTEDLYYSHEILKRSFDNNRGEYLIDWGNYPGMDKSTGMPDWQSVIVIPMMDTDHEKIMLYLSVSLRNKEFTGDVYNFVKTLCEMISTI